MKRVINEDKVIAEINKAIKNRKKRLRNDYVFGLYVGLANATYFEEGEAE